MEFISRVSAHAGQDSELCLSAHGRLPRTLLNLHDMCMYMCIPRPCGVGGRMINVLYGHLAPLRAMRRTCNTSDAAKLARSWQQGIHLPGW